jgi:hypothetical protein
MPDCVVDATVIYKANGDLKGRRAGNILDRRLTVIEQIGSGVRRLRYNQKLLAEYRQVVPSPRNDVIEIFFTALSDRAVFVGRNKLMRHQYAKAIQTCRWPSHDQHLLVAAIGGIHPSIVVTEQAHVDCASCIQRQFAVRVENLG